MAIIYDNTGKVFEDCVSNIARIINDKKVDLGLREVFNSDVLIVESYPSVSVSFDGHTEDTLSLGKDNSKIKLSMSLTVWVYLDEISPRFRSKDLERLSWEVCEIIRKNVSLDGFCMSSEIVSSRIQPRLRINMMLGAAKISVLVQKLIYRSR